MINNKQMQKKIDDQSLLIENLKDASDYHFLEMRDRDNTILAYSNKINEQSSIIDAAIADARYFEMQRDELIKVLKMMIKMAETGMVDFNPHDLFVIDTAKSLTK